MPAFVTRDGQGKETFRFDQSIVRLVGSYTVTEATRDGRIDIPDAIQGSPFYFIATVQQPDIQTNGRLARLEGRSIIWTGLDPGTVIRFGVY